MKGGTTKDESASLTLQEKLQSVMEDFKDIDNLKSLWPEITDENKQKYFDQIKIEIDIENQKLDVQTQADVHSGQEGIKDTIPLFEWKFDGESGKIDQKSIIENG